MGTRRLFLWKEYKFCDTCKCTRKFVYKKFPRRMECSVCGMEAFDFDERLKVKKKKLKAKRRDST